MGRELEGRAALVTGATSGIGRATALLFAREGARVALVARDSGRLAEVTGEVERAGGEALAVAADVTDEEGARRSVGEAVERFGGLDVLVNAAGIISNGTVETTPLSDWDAMMNVNLRAVFHLMQLAAPHLERRPGNVVNVSSVTGLRAFPGVLAYCVWIPAFAGMTEEGAERRAMRYS